MKYKKVIMLALCGLTTLLVSACSETRYAAHVIKQIPVPGERAKSVGTFKIGAPYTIKGKRYKPVETYDFAQTGMASWYGPNFHGKKTANGEIFNKYDLTAAHKTLQLPSIIRVTNLQNGRSAILRVNDRGPFAHDRILDVSERGATVLGFKNAGVTKVKIEVIGDASREVAARAKTGADTRGYEVALNKNKNLVTGATNHAAIVPTHKPEPITQIALSNPNVPIPPNAPSARRQGEIESTPYRAPLRKPAPVQAEPLRSQYQPASYNGGSNIANVNGSRIYVQAGAFSQEQNALQLSDRLSTLGTSKVYMTRINNKPFFRVRLGPYRDRSKAAEILTALNESGNKNAVIVID